MEISEALIQLKNSLAKYAKSPLLHLAEAADKLNITEEHLADLARRGKVRAFKVGEHWFMEESWVDDFRALVKKSLEQEIKSYKSSISHAHSHGWSRPLLPRRKRKLHLNFHWLFSLLNGALATAALIILVSGFSILCLPLARLGLNREVVAVNFLSATYRIYDLPAAPIRNMSISYPINDENLTYALYRLTGIRPPGQVAGAFEIDAR